MITKYKLFESIYRLPKVGDYIAIEINEDKTIGGHFAKAGWPYYGMKGEIKFAQIIQKLEDAYYIRFENETHDTYMEISYLSNSYWSESKEELEEILQANKYNL